MRNAGLSKVVVFFLILLVVLLIITIFYRSTFVCNRQKLENIVYKSGNVMILELQKGNGKDIVLFGNGYNASVDDNNRITKHDPIMTLPKAEKKLLTDGGKNKERTILYVIYPFETKGIEAAGKEETEFINKNYPNYESLKMLGQSKTAIDMANSCKWIEKKEKTLVATFSAPFGGILPDQQNLEKLNFPQEELYKLLIVPHKVNDDVTKGSELLENKNNFSGLREVRYYNYRYKLPEEVSNPLDKLLKWLDHKIGVNGDGIVGFEEQKSPFEGKEYVLEGSHRTSLQQGIKELKKIGEL